MIAATILTRFAALNRTRAAEEKTGHIRWLRPDYQRSGDHWSPTDHGKAEGDTRRPMIAATILTRFAALNRTRAAEEKNRPHPLAPPGLPT